MDRFSQISLALLAVGSALSGVEALGNSRYSLSGNYTPTYIGCPSNVTFVRPASAGLATGETTYLNKRKAVVADAMQTYLNGLAIPGLNVSQFITAIKADPALVPTIALTLR